MSEFAALSDADLSRMVTRAWREAARCWAEYRSGDGPRDMLGASAMAAEAYWQDLVDEQDRRLAGPVTSPWVTRALDGQMGAHARGMAAAPKRGAKV